MRELKPITDAGEPGTIILAAADSGAGDGERFALPVTDELRDLIAAVSGPVGDARDDADADETAAPEDSGPVAVTDSASDAAPVSDSDSDSDSNGESAGAGGPEETVEETPADRKSVV